MPSLNNISWDRLVREGAVTYPTDGADKPGNEIIFSAGYPTKSGRGKIVPANVLPPDEMPDETFPLRALDRTRARALAYRRDDAPLGVLDDLEPEAVAFMAPRELKKLGVAPGGMLRVSTRRGVDRAQGAGRQRRAAGNDLHSVLLCRSRGQSADQSGARSVRQDPGVQILRGAGRGRHDGSRGSGGIADGAMSGNGTTIR